MHQTVNRSAAKAEARRLIRTARAKPLQVTALLLILEFVLQTGTTLLETFTATSALLWRTPLAGSFLSVLITLMLSILASGYTLYCLRISRGEEQPLSSLFDGFSMVGRILAANLLMCLFIFLWTLLFIIPGIVAAYRYSFTLYNIFQYPEMGVYDAMTLSKQQTKGHKWSLFVMQLSFIGWFLLAMTPLIPYTILIFSGSIGPYIAGGLGLLVYLLVLLLSLALSLWLQPYLALTTTQYYLTIAPPPATQQQAQFIPHGADGGQASEEPFIPDPHRPSDDADSD